MADPGFALIFAVSLVAGFFGAMTGLGGGTIIVPVLTYLGVDIKLAIAASMVSVIATSCSSAAAYIRQGLVNLKVGMYLEMFTVIGALLGASLTLVSGQDPLFVAFGVILIAAAISLFVKQRLAPETAPPGRQDRFSRWLGLSGCYEDRAEKQTISYAPTRAALGGPLMVAAGVISGLLGIGAGAFKVLVMDLAMDLPTKVSTSTSTLIIGVTALAGSSVYLAAGLVDPALVVPVILGVAAGALAGTVLLVRITNQAVRNYFMVVVMIIGVYMIVQGVA
jgi:uncharacterized membrane protein YfcA